MTVRAVALYERVREEVPRAGNVLVTRRQQDQPRVGNVGSAAPRQAAALRKRHEGRATRRCGGVVLPEEARATAVVVAVREEVHICGGRDRRQRPGRCGEHQVTGAHAYVLVQREVYVPRRHSEVARLYLKVALVHQLHELRRRAVPGVVHHPQEAVEGAVVIGVNDEDQIRQRLDHEPVPGARVHSAPHGGADAKLDPGRVVKLPEPGDCLGLREPRIDSGVVVVRQPGERHRGR